jgi:hypothetical protein
MDFASVLPHVVRDLDDHGVHYALIGGMAIFQLIRHARDASVAIDWELVADYLELFDLGDKLPELTHVYGQTH